MKKYFLILPILFFSFLIGNYSMAMAIGDIYGGGKIAEFDSSHILIYSNNSLSTTNWNNGINIALNSTQNGFNDWRLPTATEASIIYTSMIGASGTCWTATEANETEARLIVYSSGSIFTIAKIDNYSIKAVRVEYITPPLTASSSLILIANSALLPAIDLSTNIFFNYWPYILVIGIIAGFIIFILKKLPKRWPK